MCDLDDDMKELQSIYVQTIRYFVTLPKAKIQKSNFQLIKDLANVRPRISFRVNSQTALLV